MESLHGFFSEYYIGLGGIGILCIIVVIAIGSLAGKKDVLKLAASQYFWLLIIVLTTPLILMMLDSKS